ncbi:MAG: YitT family protein, partial [Erysipelotrichia bacterium]|nr:YitT family protein [Erysipelotrichia bacterium]
MKLKVSNIYEKLIEGFTWKKILWIAVGAMIYSFGIHNIHQRTDITEGGIIGLMLLVEHWLRISPAYITPALDFICYLLAFKFLGTRFIKVSAVSTLFVSGFYKIWELFPPMLPDLSAYPLIAAILG